MISLTKFCKEVVEDTTYLKFVANKAHMGPISEEKAMRNKAKSLTAAANNIRILADFSVKISNDNDQKGGNDQCHSYLIQGVGLTSDAVTKSAFLLMQAWDKVFPGEGTQGYMDKMGALIEARHQVYANLGIKIKLTDDKREIRPDLSVDQRKIYNASVGPLAFDYYEYHIAFKLETRKKFVRSKSFRSLQPLDISSKIRELDREVNRLQQLITITTKQTN